VALARVAAVQLLRTRLEPARDHLAVAAHRVEVRGPAQARGEPLQHLQQPHGDRDVSAGVLPDRVEGGVEHAGEVEGARGDP
jgi:hypothetical protein